MFPLDNVPLYMHTHAIYPLGNNNDKQAAVPLTMMFVKPVYPLFTQDNNNTIIHLLFFPYSALAIETPPTTRQTCIRPTAAVITTTIVPITILYPFPSHCARTIYDSTRYCTTLPRKVSAENRWTTECVTEKYLKRNRASF